MKRLKSILKKKKIDIALFCTLNENFDKNLYYLSNYAGLGCLVVPKNKPAFLLVPEMEYEKAKKTSAVGVYKWKKGKRLFGEIGLFLKKKRIKPKTIGLTFSTFTLALDKSLKRDIKGAGLKDISKECVELRKIKSEHEISIIRKSCRITDKIIKKCISQFSKFRTEKDVEIFLKTETLKNGCELAFPPIIASGKSSSMPHYQSKSTKLKKGFCVIDFGVNYKGYHSDITRTVFLGNPSKKDKETYTLLLNTQKKLIKNIKLNKECKTSFEETGKMLGKYSENFIHGLGHGLGLQIHELPNLTPDSEDSFRNNMVFTVEPGIYFPGRFGIRIEDDILIHRNKAYTLTKTPKTLKVIK